MWPASRPVPAAASTNRNSRMYSAKVIGPKRRMRSARRGPEWSRGNGSAGVFFLEGLPGGFEDVAGARIEEDEVDCFDGGFALEVPEGLGEHDLGTLVHGKAGDAGADSGESDGFEVAFGGGAERVGGGGAK